MAKKISVSSKELPKDKYGRTFKVGLCVAYAGLNYKSAVLRVGVITEIYRSPTDNLIKLQVKFLDEDRKSTTLPQNAIIINNPLNKPKQKTFNFRTL